MSYAAAPWCANSGSEKIETPIPRAMHIKNLPFKRHLLFGGAQAASFGWVRRHLSELDAILKAASAIDEMANTNTNASGKYCTCLATPVRKARRSSRGKSAESKINVRLIARGHEEGLPSDAH
jgi:hypothetical protein